MDTPDQVIPLPEHLHCQTPGCPNAVAVAIVRLEDGESDQFCMACCLSFWLAVLQQASRDGTIPQLAEPAATP